MNEILQKSGKKQMPQKNTMGVPTTPTPVPITGMYPTPPFVGTTQMGVYPSGVVAPTYPVGPMVYPPTGVPPGYPMGYPGVAPVYPGGVGVPPFRQS